MSRSWRVVLPVAIASAAIAGCGGDERSGGELLSGDGLERALDAVREEAGEDASLLRVQITDRGSEFQLAGARPRGLIYTGEALQETEIVTAGGVAAAAFPLADVDPEAVERLIDGAEAQRDGSFEPVAITLERSRLDGELRWTVNGQDGGEFIAGPDGTEPIPAADAPVQGPQARRPMEASASEISV